MTAPLQILVLDPSLDVVEATRRALRTEAATVYATTDVESALVYLPARQPAVVVIGDGFDGPTSTDLIRSLSRDPACAEARIAALYDTDDEDRVARLLEAGACASLPRPFTDQAFRLWIAGVIFFAPEVVGVRPPSTSPSDGAAADRRRAHPGGDRTASSSR
jgi:DNA-binding response OmpR family regulator